MFASWQGLGTLAGGIGGVGVVGGLGGGLGALGAAGAAAAAAAAAARAAPAPPLTPQVTKEEGLQLSLKARRIWIRNMAADADLDSVKKSLLELMALQHLRVFNEGEAILSIVPNPNAEEGGAIMELRTVREAQRARKGLYGVTLNNTTLEVGWPSDYVPLTDEEIKKLMATAILGIDGDGSVPVPSDEATARNCCMVLAADATSAPLEVEATTILVLSNLASEEELNNEQDATDIMEDTKEKCEKDFGGVDAALLITPGTGGIQPTPTTFPFARALSIYHSGCIECLLRMD